MNKLSSRKKVVVIGAGFGGLSVAALLAKDGHQVTVLEKNPTAGGRGRVWVKDGFTFDLGPSWYTMPEVFDRFFKLFDKKTADYYKLKRLDPSYRIFFGRNDTLDISTELKKNIALFESMEAGGGKKLKDYLKQAEYQYTQAMSSFIYKDYPSLMSMLDLKLVAQINKLHLLEDMDSFTKRWFKNDRLRKILLYTLVFLGGAPKKTPALYALMSHIDFNLGIWYPMGGLGKVVTSLQQLAEEEGATFSFNQTVKSIEVNSGVATQVLTQNKKYDADIVVTNADYAHAETKLLEEKWQSYPKSYWDKRTVAPSAFLIYLGLNKKVKNLKHHSLFFHHDWVEHFNQIFEEPQWPDKPSYYVCCPSKTDPIMAPKGKENIFLLVPIAAGLKDTPSIREKYYRKIMDDFQTTLGQDIEDDIILKRIYSLKDFEKDYNAFKGTALGLTHTMFQTAYFRPHHRSKKVKNLYYTGQFTHPGIGVPITLISAQIVREIIKKTHND